MRRRRAVAVLAVVAVALTACGSESSSDADRDHSVEPPEGTGITVTATNGEILEFTDFLVTCQPTHEDDGVRWKTAVHAIGGAGGSDPMTDPRVPAMMIKADAAVPDRSTVELPHHNKRGQKETFVSVFVTDAGTATELSSAVEETAGQIEVLSAGCEPRPHLEMRIDATLHSEYIDGGTATAVGSMSAG